MQILGQSAFQADEPGNNNSEPISLTHPSHTTFHKEPLAQEQIIQEKRTRFYCWHIDSALHDLSTPMVTSILGIKMPSVTNTWTIDYDNGRGDVLQLTQAAFCFVSGAAAFERLSTAEKQFALNTTVEYTLNP